MDAFSDRFEGVIFMIKFASRVAYMQASADVSRHLFESMTEPDVLFFSGGAPAKETLPVEEMREIAMDVFTRDARGVEALQYNKPAGSYDLRRAVVDHLLAPKGIKATTDNVLITGGGMEAFSMTAQLLLDKDDVVLVESPSFVQSIQGFEMLEAKCVSCMTDDNGYVISDVEAKIKKYSPKAIYVIPTFQNPSGRTMSLERRKELAELANKYDVVVIEDDPYAELRYSGEELPPVNSFDKSGDFIYLNSFSKIFSPGCRLGYIYASKEIIDRLYDIKTATNSHTSMISQVICAEYFERGYYEPHMQKMISIHRERRDTMMKCIEELFPKNCKYIYPDGGLFTWVELPEHIDTTELLKDAMQEKVAFMPGEKFFVEPCEIRKNCMRLSFGGMEPENIKIGMERLAKAIEKKM